MKKITQDLFYKFNFLSNINYSPNKTKYAFINTDIVDNKYHKTLYVGSDENINMISDIRGIDNYSFIDDDNILFIDNNNTTSYIKRLNLSNLSVDDIFKFNLDINDIKIYDDYYLVLARVDLNASELYLMDEMEVQEYNQKLKDNEDYVVIDEYPFFFNGEGYINKLRNSLFIINKNDLSIKRIGPKTLDVESYDVNENKIIISGIDYQNLKAKWSQIYEYDTQTYEFNCLYAKEDMIISKVVYLKNKKIVVGSFSKDYGAMENCKIYCLNNNVMELLIDTDTSFYGSVGSDSRFGKHKGFYKEDDKLYFISTNDDKAELYVLDGDEIKTVVSFEGTVDDYDVGEKIILIGMVNQELQEVYEYDKELKKLSNFNEFMNEYDVIKPEELILKKNDFEIKGWVLTPSNYIKGKKYPAIIDIHGGPKTAYGTVYYHEMQMFANMGYFVFYANPRGSDGKGNAFADLRHNFGKIDYQDLMEFTDLVLKTYCDIDDERLAVIGGSYGGYMTNWIISHTDRFKVAVSQRSISNWISEVCASDYGLDFPIEQEFDDLYNCHDELWDMSPLKYANNIKTPTLFIHSFEDYRCPYPEALQLYTTMVLRGVEARICLFKKENHELSRSGEPLHRLRRLNEMLEWINKHLMEV